MVQSKWNMAAIIQECEQNQKKLFMCLAEDTIDEQPLTIKERFMAVETTSKCGKNCHEKGGLPDLVELSIGMKFIVTLNVEMILDIVGFANVPVVGLQSHQS